MAYDEDLADRIRELVASEQGLTEKKMFGGLAFLIGGNMSVAASGQGGLMVRVDPAETDALLAKPHAQPFERRGRKMEGWLRIDDDGVRTKRQLEPWVKRGVAYARSLPPKKRERPGRSGAAAPRQPPVTPCRARRDGHRGARGVRRRPRADAGRKSKA